MDLDAHGVAQPVAEAALVARAVDDIPGNLVHLAAFVARFSIRRAQVITDACFEHMPGYIKPGVREIDAALEMEVFMKSHGAGKLAFDTIFVSGAKTSLPHGVPGDKRIEAGDFVTMDFGANVDGY